MANQKNKASRKKGGGKKSKYQQYKEKQDLFAILHQINNEQKNRNK